jgi:hypothetical protein
VQVLGHRDEGADLREIEVGDAATLPTPRRLACPALGARRIGLKLDRRVVARG